MGKREDLQSQIEALQAELDGADDDDVELWVEHERGGKNVRTKLSGSHAKGWLDDLFGTSEKKEESEEGEEEDEDTKKDKKPASGGSYFAKRKG